MMSSCSFVAFLLLFIILSCADVQSCQAQSKMIFTFFPLFLSRGWICSIMAVSCAKSASAQLTAEDATQAVTATCAAVSMSFTTAAGWETIARWFVGTSTVVAPMRLANRRSASGGIA